MRNKMLFLVLVASLATGDALAQGIDCPALGSPPVGVVSDRKLSQTLFEKGRRLHEAGKYREAMVAFVASYHAAPGEAQPALVYNVGKATERAGDLVNAAAFYRCYLATNPAPGPGRDEATKRLAAIEKSVPRARIALPIDTQWDDQSQSSPQAIPQTPIDDQWEETASSSQPRRRIWTWMAAGVAGMALATGIGFGISSDRKFEDLEDRGCARTPEGCPRDEVQAIERNQLIANIAFGVAAAGAISTGMLWLYEGRSATVGVKVNPTSASVSVRW